MRRVMRKPHALLVPVLLLLSACTEAIPTWDRAQAEGASTTPPCPASRCGELLRAAADGDASRVQKLLAQGVDIDAGASRTTDTVTPLMAATLLKKNDVAQLLIVKGASFDPAFHGYTVRDFAFLLNPDLIPLIENRSQK